MNQDNKKWINKSMIRKMAVALTILLQCCFVAGCNGREAAVTLLPEGALLDLATDVVVEPDEAPYNLGGWLEGNTVYWQFEIEEEGMHTFLIEYSRPGDYPETWGLMELNKPDGEITPFNFTVEPTGVTGGEDDWSVYTINDSCGAHLEPGEYTLSISANYDFRGEYDGPPHFINLRSVKLVRDYEG
jgi:hypothetical protein